MEEEIILGRDKTSEAFKQFLTSFDALSSSPRFWQTISKKVVQ
jgi:hypothetical protein